MKIEYDGKIYEMHYSFRIGMLYEQIQGKSIDLATFNQFDLIMLFYASFLSTLQYHKVNNIIRFEDFMNWIDDNGGEKLVVEFSNWYVNVIKQQYELIGNSDKEIKDKKEGEPDPNV